uniref:Uncharacterized protein n=1 Tax=Echinococcus granulosus TaxID=6210 RepID=A0A068WYC9_ECHGR|nr:hypothetical protein EgrG_001105400 [Echinococcus granulosus]
MQGYGKDEGGRKMRRWRRRRRRRWNVRPHRRYRANAEKTLSICLTSIDFSVTTRLTTHANHSILHAYAETDSHHSQLEIGANHPD